MPRDLYEQADHRRARPPPDVPVAPPADVPATPPPGPREGPTPHITVTPQTTPYDQPPSDTPVVPTAPPPAARGANAVPTTTDTSLPNVPKCADTRLSADRARHGHRARHCTPAAPPAQAPLVAPMPQTPTAARLEPGAPRSVPGPWRLPVGTVPARVSGAFASAGAVALPQRRNLGPRSQEVDNQFRQLPQLRRCARYFW